MIKGIIPAVIIAAVFWVFWITWDVLRRRNKKDDQYVYDYSYMHIHNYYGNMHT